MITELKTKTITLDELIDAFLGATSHLSPHTQRYYRTYLKNFGWYAHEFGWPEAAGEITRDHIRQFLNYISSNTNRWGREDPTRSSSRRATPGTIFHYGVVIKRLFRWASDEEEYVKENGIWRLKLPSPHFRQVEPYTDTEVMSLLEACEEEYRFRSRFLGSRNGAIIAVFCDTGIRLSELAGIKLSDLHSSLKQLRVTGKGWLADDPEMRAVYPVTIDMQKRAKVVEEHPFENTGYVIMEDEETRIRWVKQVY